MKKNNLLKTFFIYLIISLFISISFSIYKNYIDIENSTLEQYNYTYLLKSIEEDNLEDIQSINIKPSETGSGFATITFKDKKTPSKTISIPSVTSFMNFLHSHIDNNIINSIIKTSAPSKGIKPLSFIIPIILIVLIISIIISTLLGKGSSISTRATSFGRSKAKIYDATQSKITFKDVAGLKEEKEDLEEVVEFLKSPKSFEEMGARIPKGILLVGPPGTGKTLLARAIAGEASVKFFSISGSDFVEMFVGVGASRVRDLFDEAKKNKPALIFIDEIDAVGRRRGSGLGGGHDEREQTLNQLLVEMDGFMKNEGIIVLAATNRPDILDPALLRPGRFDRQIIVDAPDVKGREEILQVHIKGKKIDDSINIKEIAKMTSGFTGAELENLMNEAALLATKQKKEKINIEHVKKAFIKVGIGTERKSRVISEEERKITAYHEAGHAILHEMLPLLDPVHLVSIIPTGMAGGYTMPLPVDKGYLSKNYLIQNIMSLFGGRIAEEIIFGDITTGASNDIERATKTAYSMVAKYGMSDLGPIQFEKDKISDKLYSEVDKTAEKIISTAYNSAKEIIVENIEILHKAADLLLEKEKILGDEFRALFPENAIPEKKKPTLVSFSNDNVDENATNFNN